jgi:hypothetical protein
MTNDFQPLNKQEWENRITELMDTIYSLPFSEVIKQKSDIIDILFGVRNTLDEAIKVFTTVSTKNKGLYLPGLPDFKELKCKNKDVEKIK